MYVSAGNFVSVKDFHLEADYLCELFEFFAVVAVNDNEVMSVAAVCEYMAEFSCAAVDMIIYGRAAFDIAVSTADDFAFGGAGAAELTARIVICSFLPALVNGAPIDSGASSLAFAAVCFGDPGAWICASLLLLIPLFRYIIGKKYKNTV